MKSEDEQLENLQREALSYFIHEANPDNGLILDKTKEGWPASVAAVGMALSAYAVGAERGFMSRKDATRRTLNTLRFFQKSKQSADPDATGYKGFYYHFLDMETGVRVWDCEVSTIDSALLFAGMLVAAEYFSEDVADEREIRALAEDLYLRADWNWALCGGPAVSQGWTPETGFLSCKWQGYDEALLLYLLGLGSPTHPLPVESFTNWTSTYRWRKAYDQEYLYSGPLFTHQMSHVWVDFRGIQDEYMRGKGIDYFENTRRATYVQRAYAIDNPCKFERYGPNCWGITATDGPGPAERKIDGQKGKFLGYEARGVPDGPDDGTIAPWCVVASLPFAPEIVLPAVQYFENLKLHAENKYGFKATFNCSFPDDSAPWQFWVSPYHFGINQGPIISMIENYRSGMLWQLTRENAFLTAGLRRCGFSGGWLND